MNNITINSNSNDIKEMEKLFPRAPRRSLLWKAAKNWDRK